MLNLLPVFYLRRSACAQTWHSNIKLRSIVASMVGVLSVWAIMLIVSESEVTVWAHSVEPISRDFSVHVCDITPAVLDCVTLGPFAETHFSHE